MKDLSKGNLIIRADASTQTGSGHLMRCLALAQAWKDAGGEVTFITACQNEGLLQRLQFEGFEVYVLACSHPDPIDWNYTKEILATYPDAWVVLDGYHFDEEYQQRVKEIGHQLLVIDDTAHLKHYYADIVLNQNLHAEQLNYYCEPYTCLLFGTHYVLLRREFLAWREWRREIPKLARHVLVTLGGADPENYMLKVLQALQRVDVPSLEAIAVIGASNPHADVLEAAIRKNRIPIRLICDAKNMPEIMAWADVAISSAGITTWELLFLGVPSLFLTSADNQHYLAEKIANQDAGEVLGGAKNTSVQLLTDSITSIATDFDCRAKLSEIARTLVDGQGAYRVVTVVRQASSHRLQIIPATMGDCHLLWEWRNDPVVRTNSFSSNPIPWDDHMSWFREKLIDPNCLMYLILDGVGTPVGQVRFDIHSEGIAETDLSIAEKERSKGHGSTALKLACQHALHECNISKILSHIKEQNQVSISAFTKAGFINKGLTYFEGNKAMKMEWEVKSL